MTKTIENPIINLSKESDKLIQKSYEKRNKNRKIVEIKKIKNKKSLEWLNEI